MNLGKIFGISIELHSTFVWLMLLMAIFLAVMQPEQLVSSIVLMAILFATVFVHELFHSAVAIYKGVRVSKIILLPIGGVSVAEEMPENPKDEFQIAVAGPLFNFVMVILIALAVKALPSVPWPYFLFSHGITAESFNFAIMNYPLFALFWVNLLLGAFNLFLPALPMDGGRVFRALLASRIGFFRATKIAASLSIFIAIFLFLLGFLFQDLIVLIIAVFIYFGAVQEREFAKVKEFVGRIDLKGAVDKMPLKIKGSATLKEAIEKMKKARETSILVVLENGFGIINAEGIPEKANGSRKVSEICEKIELIPVERTEKIITAIFAKKATVAAVSEKGRFIGTISETEINKMRALSRLDIRK